MLNMESNKYPYWIKHFFFSKCNIIQCMQPFPMENCVLIGACFVSFWELEKMLLAIRTNCSWPSYQYIQVRLNSLQCYLMEVFLNNHWNKLCIESNVYFSVTQIRTHIGFCTMFSKSRRPRIADVLVKFHTTSTQFLKYTERGGVEVGLHWVTSKFTLI